MLNVMAWFDSALAGAVVMVGHASKLGAPARRLATFYEFNVPAVLKNDSVGEAPDQRFADQQDHRCQ